MHHAVHHPRRRRPRTSAACLGALITLSVATLTVAAAPASPGPVSAPQQQFFESKVRPLLAEHCFSCHGEKKQKGGLRLDSAAAALKGGKNGVVLVPGKPEASPLVTAVSYKDADLQMPPDEPLPADQAQVLADWVKMGAPWPELARAPAVAAAPPAKGKHRTITDVDRAFWSFQPVKDPAPPVVQGVVDGKDWCRNPIDRFVLAKLRPKG